MPVKGGLCLKTIRRRTVVFAASTGFGIIISVSIFFWGILAPEIQLRILLAVSTLVSGCMGCLWVREYRTIKTARLIVENPILHIRTAIISKIFGDAEEPEEIENTDVFVSYFGILLEAKIIKFNQDGILLKAVEIGRDYILLSYGTDKWVQNTRLLRAVISNEELGKIVERFRYETGIVPVIVS